jgi:hypothetical protein
MMQPFRRPWLLLILALGCAGKDETGATDTTGGASSTGTTAATTLEPTTTGTTGTSTTTGTTAEGTTAVGPPCETSPEDCGVMVSDVGSVCPDMPPAKDELKLEVLGPGKLRITEIGRDGGCGITYGTNVIFGPNNLIIVTYEIQGNPDPNCTCKYEVTTTLSNLAPATYSVMVGSWSDMVDVP